MSASTQYVPLTHARSGPHRARVDLCFRQGGPGRAGQGAGGAWGGNPLNRRVSQVAARRRAQGGRGQRPYGLPRDHGRRVKTLQPSIHGGILARRTDTGHQKAMSDHRIAGIDLVVVNLYPFEATVARGADFPTCVENIDIGGPALIRASAKNHDFVTVVVDPRTMARCSGARCPQGRHDAGAAPQARGQGLRPHGVLQFGDRQLVRRAGGRDLPRAADDLGRARADGLRREPAPESRVL